MSIEISFLGAARTVTGSKYLISDGKHKIMVDCGMFQGTKDLTEMNYQDFAFEPSEINYLILTHAHIDHSGLVPRLVKKGFRGKILCTKPTMELCKIMFIDAAHVESIELEWRNRKRVRAGKEPLDPVYTVSDAEECMKYFETREYNKAFPVNGFKVRFVDAGHILGSAIVEISYSEKNKNKRVVFSGDVGNERQEILSDPTKLKDTDYLVVESTYGDRLHKSRQETVKEFAGIIKKTKNTGGNIIIPAFAIERTQEIIYELRMLYDKKKLEGFTVYVDSPLAIAATEIFRANTGFFDRTTKNRMKKGMEPFDFPSLIFAKRADDSKALNEVKSGAIIISASGMCEAGRIIHHLKHNLWRKECNIVFTGFQARGTLGDAIIKGNKTVKIFGEEIAVNAKIYTLGGFSGHADRKGLLNWVSNFKNKKPKVFVVHGEESSALKFGSFLRKKLKLKVKVPKLGEKAKI